jgi:hypothetical protein
MVADEIRRQFFELRDGPTQPFNGPPPFSGPPPMGLLPGPFDPLEAMQLGIGLGMEMAAAAAGAAAAAPHVNGPGPGPGMNSAPQRAPDGGLSIAGLVPDFRSSAEAGTPVTVTYKLVVPENKAGRFIGKGGEVRQRAQVTGDGPAGNTRVWSGAVQRAFPRKRSSHEELPVVTPRGP